MKPSILSKFLARRATAAILLVALTVAGIIYVVSFVERLGDNPDTVSALGAAALQILEYIPMFMPMAVFMGALLAMYWLTKSSESVILSGAGMSPYQILRPFLWVTATIGVIMTCVASPLYVYFSNNRLQGNQLEMVDNALWLSERDAGGSLILRAQTVDSDNDNVTFGNAVIFEQNADNQLLRRIEAKKITLSGGFLATQNATVYGADGIPHAGQTVSVKSISTRANIMERYLRPEQVSVWQLPKFIKNMERIGLNPRAHLVKFWTLAFSPLTLLSLGVLGYAFSVTRSRRNYSFGVKFGIGILVCFILYFIINIFAAIGSSGALPAVIAVASPPLIILFAASAFIVSFDSV